MHKRWSFFIILSVTLFVIITKVSDNHFGKNGNYGVIDWDGFGYYLYLPSLFIYNDVKLENLDWVESAQKKYNLSTSFYQAHYISKNGNSVIQYTSGMAFFFSPAFFVGHAIATVTDYEADGFSKPYQIAILIQSFLVLFLGLHYLRKWGLLFFSDQLTAILILIICLGTNYFQIASVNSSSPHIYLFGLYALLLYVTSKWHEKPKLVYSIIIGVFSSLMILTRPNELLFLFIPIAWLGGKFSTYQQKIQFFLKNKMHVWVVIVPLFLFGIVQPIYWRFTAGEWLFDSYPNEDFKLLKPYILDYLFSYKKGWLLYTPIMILALVGFVPLVKKMRRVGIPLMVFVIVNIWILSSWDCWWYADSFGQRSIVQSYPVFLLPLGYILKPNKSHSTSLKKGLLYILISLLTVFNLFQTWQFKQYIIHPQRMTKAYYWNSFFKTKNEDVNKRLIGIDRTIEYLPENEKNNRRVIYSESFMHQNNGLLEVNGELFQEEGNLILSKEVPRSTKIKFAYKDIADTSYCYIICRIRFKSEFDAEENPFGIEFKMVDAYNKKEYAYKYRGVEQISWFKRGVWRSMDMVTIPPDLRNEDDSVQFNLMLYGENPVLIDEMLIELIEPSNHSKREVIFYNDYHTITNGNWSKPRQSVGEKGYEMIDSLSPFSSTIREKLNPFESKRAVEFSASIAQLENSNQELYAVVSVISGEDKEFYQPFRIRKNTNKDWSTETFSAQLPKGLPIDAELHCYIWNKSGSPILIRSMQVKLE